MTKLELYEKTSFANSETITRLYSTSFATAIKLLAPRMRTPIHGIYGFVRFADEIVDTFHQTIKVQYWQHLKLQHLKRLKISFRLIRYCMRFK